MPTRFAVLVFPGFPMMAFSAVIEPLRAANIISGETLYEWIIVGADKEPVSASCGIEITVDNGAHDAPLVDYMVVCSGGDADRITAVKPLAWIRKNLRKGASIGSVADGAFYLARAGLLDGYSCTLHWRSQPAFIEAFPDIVLAHTIYTIDRTRFTSAGGIGAFDMMLDIIGQQNGDDLSKQIAAWFVHDRIRADADRERLQLRLRTGIVDELVLEAVRFFETANDETISISGVAEELGISLERLERAFKVEVGMGPAQYYKHVKMQRAQDLLEHSKMSVREIGLASGYASFSSFVRAFRTVYGKTPRMVRTRSQTSNSR